MSVEPSLRESLKHHGQEHLLQFWDELDAAARDRLERELRTIDLDQMEKLIAGLVQDSESVEIRPEDVLPVAVERIPHTDAERVARRRASELGESMLADGKVAVVMVAGGQGTRLGYDGPKGTYPIGPVSGATLFQIHAEKIVALGRRYGRPIPLYLMTSPENDQSTRDYFSRHENHGLSHLRTFVQGQLPAVDQASGKLLLSDKGRLALSPDGHGGTLTALAAPGPNGAPSCLDEMRDHGIETLFYFQVDNPLVQICDPAYLGLHQLANAEISFKVVEKRSPDEKVGVVVRVGEEPRVIEYSDLDPALAEERDPDGGLRFWAGSIAIHCFARSFIERLTGGECRLPFHRALKKVPYMGPNGQRVEPESPNAIKFETFIFDALPMARAWTVVEAERAIEFEPLKNATGPDSPATVRQRLSDLHADWLERAGAQVMRRPDGSVPFGIEISPLLALDAAELRSKLAPGLVVDQPTYLGPRD